LVDVEDYEAETFAVAKKNYWETNTQRAQSNNSLLFWKKPSREELSRIFNLMIDAGGSEPGFINAEAASKRAPWFCTINPCAEILLPNKGLCNLVTIDIAKFKGDTNGLHRALYIMARANYRQTLVNLDDGILQEAWHLNNEFLRLCGVNITGIAKRPDLVAYDYRSMERTTTSAAYSMANELGLQLPKNVTTVQPSGSLSKCFATTEGVHKPLGKFIFNNIVFGNHDENLPALRDAGYKVVPHPFDPVSSLVTFPVRFDDVPFDIVDGKEVNLETAIDQLERYKLLQTNWNQQNTSVTISYDVNEVEGIKDWLLANWDIYVGVSFLFRTDATMTAADLGYAYLPQEVVTEEMYNEYVAILKPIGVSGSYTEIEDVNTGCVGGVCPVK
jgi:ribonucleoside-triphosphate reductase